jgi:hypothetical protein
MKKVNSNIAIFYIALILLFKVAGLHAFIHHADDADVQHCEACPIVTEINLIPLLDTDTSDIPKVEFFYPQQKINTVSPVVVFNNRHLSSYLFTRPPPFVS